MVTPPYDFNDLAVQALENIVLKSPVKAAAVGTMTATGLADEVCLVPSVGPMKKNILSFLMGTECPAKLIAVQGAGCGLGIRVELDRQRVPSRGTVKLKSSSVKRFVPDFVRRYRPTRMDAILRLIRWSGH